MADIEIDEFTVWLHRDSHLFDTGPLPQPRTGSLTDLRGVQRVPNMNELLTGMQHVIQLLGPNALVIVNAVGLMAQAFFGPKIVELLHFMFWRANMPQDPVLSSVLSSIDYTERPLLANINMERAVVTDLSEAENVTFESIAQGSVSARLHVTDIEILLQENAGEVFLQDGRFWVKVQSGEGEHVFQIMPSQGTIAFENVVESNYEQHEASMQGANPRNDYATYVLKEAFRQLGAREILKYVLLSNQHEILRAFSLGPTGANFMFESEAGLASIALVIAQIPKEDRYSLERLVRTAALQHMAQEGNGVAQSMQLRNIRAVAIANGFVGFGKAMISRFWKGMKQQGQLFVNGGLKERLLIGGSFLATVYMSHGMVIGGALSFMVNTFLTQETLNASMWDKAKIFLNGSTHILYGLSEEVIETTLRHDPRLSLVILQISSGVARGEFADHWDSHAMAIANVLINMPEFQNLDFDVLEFIREYYTTKDGFPILTKNLPNDPVKLKLAIEFQNQLLRRLLTWRLTDEQKELYDELQSKVARGEELDAVQHQQLQAMLMQGMAENAAQGRRVVEEAFKTMFRYGIYTLETGTFANRQLPFAAAAAGLLTSDGPIDAIEAGVTAVNDTSKIVNENRLLIKGMVAASGGFMTLTTVILSVFLGGKGDGDANRSGFNIPRLSSQKDPPAHGDITWVNYQEFVQAYQDLRVRENLKPLKKWTSMVFLMASLAPFLTGVEVNGAMQQIKTVYKMFNIGSQTAIRLIRTLFGNDLEMYETETDNEWPVRQTELDELFLPIVDTSGNLLFLAHGTTVVSHELPIVLTYDSTEEEDGEYTQTLKFLVATNMEISGIAASCIITGYQYETDLTRTARPAFSYNQRPDGQTEITVTFRLQCTCKFQLRVMAKIASFYVAGIVGCTLLGPYDEPQPDFTSLYDDTRVVLDEIIQRNTTEVQHYEDNFPLQDGAIETHVLLPRDTTTARLRYGGYSMSILSMTINDIQAAALQSKLNLAINVASFKADAWAINTLLAESSAFAPAVSPSADLKAHWKTKAFQVFSNRKTKSSLREKVDYTGQPVEEKDLPLWQQQILKASDKYGGITNEFLAHMEEDEQGLIDHIRAGKHPDSYQYVVDYAFIEEDEADDKEENIPAPVPDPSAPSDDNTPLIVVGIGILALGALFVLNRRAKK